MHRDAVRRVVVGVVIAVMASQAAWAQPSAALERHALAIDATFLKRVEMLAVKVALAVQAEDQTTCCYPPGVTEATATPEQRDAARRLAQQRSALAGAVLLQSEVLSRQLGKAVATNPAIEVSSSDADIEFTLTSVWNAFARAR